jgi:dipeptidyl aminopeptidase/acylaminoacyl peptidase
MALRAAVALLGALICAFSSAAADAPSHPPVEDFGSLPFLAQPALSPDGRHIASIQAYQGTPVIAIYDEESAGPTPPVAVRALGIPTDIFWANNERLVITSRQSGYIFLHDFQSQSGTIPEVYWDSWVVSADGSNRVPLSVGPFSPVFGATANTDATNPDDIVAPMAMTFSPRFNLMRINVNTGKVSTERSGATDTKSWILDGGGKVVARIAVSTDGTQEEIEQQGFVGWRTVKTISRRDELQTHVEGLLENGTALAVSQPGPHGTTALYALDLNTGKFGDPLFDNPSYDLDHVLRDDRTGRVIGVAWSDDGMEHRYFDTRYQQRQDALEHAFPGMSVEIVSMSAASDIMLVSVTGPKSPVTYYYFDARTSRADLIGSTYPDLTDKDLGEVRPYPYKARDGLDIHAYLTLPPGKPATRLPVVVMPHGGPDARDDMEFDWWSQFLANRGYAVLRPNFRGSSGYGDAFTQAGLHQWGLKMQDDITDGVKKLIADGIADPKRICIVGASYGGYAALAGAAFTPDLYACAVSVAGVSDLEALQGTDDDEPVTEMTRFWSLRIGDMKTDSVRIRATSPAQHVDAIRIPILLMASEGDRTVPYSQSVAMNDALKKAGKTVRFVTLEGDDHYLALAATRVRILRETEAFLKQYIGD